MGNTCQLCLIDPSQRSTNLLIATLNYGGILKSPFEFYSDQQLQEKQLSECFLRLLPLYIKNFDLKNFQWDIGKIDHKLQQQRYTPLYNSSVGIEKSWKGQKLITSSSFQKLWQQYYKTGTKNTKVEPEPSKIQKENMKLLDLICYHAIIDHVYNLSSTSKLSDMDKKIGKLDSSSYIDFMKKKFSKSFLNQNKKIQKVLSVLNQVDVFFFQEPTKLLIDTLVKDNNLFVKENGPEAAMIVIRKKNFMVNNNFYVEDVRKLNLNQNYFNFNGNTDGIAVVIDKLIFVSAHLSSKQSKNVGQVKALKQILSRMRSQFSDYQVVLGSDTNSHINAQGLSGYKVYPRQKQNITTAKKRTFLQAQFKKANKIVEDCKDHIITTCQIMRSSVKTIDNQTVDRNQLLPTDNHPFDHFMVVCKIRT